MDRWRIAHFHATCLRKRPVLAVRNLYSYHVISHSFGQQNHLGTKVVIPQLNFITGSKVESDSLKTSTLCTWSPSRKKLASPGRIVVTAHFGVNKKIVFLFIQKAAKSIVSWTARTPVAFRYKFCCSSAHTSCLIETPSNKLIMAISR